jgi:hypothetical protein
MDQSYCSLAAAIAIASHPDQPRAFRSGQIWENRLDRWMHQLVVGDI